MKSHLVEILVFAACPHADAARSAVQAALRQVGAGVRARTHVVEIEVGDEAHARALRFLGSPTVRVDGFDVELSSAARMDFGLQCRLYRVGDKRTTAPPAEWVAALLPRVDAPPH